MYSDVHSAINVVFSCMNNDVLHNDDFDDPQGDIINDNLQNVLYVHDDVPLDNVNPDLNVKWNHEGAHSFINGLNNDRISTLDTSLDELRNQIEEVDLEKINAITKDIQSILIDSATAANMAKKKRKKYPIIKIKDKPWFDLTCKLKRRVFLKSKNRSVKFPNSDILKCERKKAAKEYKKFVKKCKRNFDFKLANEIRNMRTNDPRKFWNILNKNNANIKPNEHPSCDDFVNMFKMFGNDNVNDNNDAVHVEPEVPNPALNNNIDVVEVQKCIHNLKSHKAHGLDHIINEFLKNASPKMSIIFTKLFNLVLDTGIVPTEWVIGIIHPIYKNKGNRKDPHNYRGITILSCFGKLFTSILNERIRLFIEQDNILGKEQAGFRKHHSTIDHLFSLYGLIDILLSKRKRLYCAFLDFEKAFDKVDRAYLWQKLLDQNINGKILTVIKNLYSNAKSCVTIDSKTSDFFRLNIGVRQGENLSPILFALFLNDMNDYMSNVMTGLETVGNAARECGMNDDDLHALLNVFLLLYADDTVIFAEKPEQLQDGLNRIKSYCDLWKLKLNPSKCKVIIFSRGKVRVFPQFYIGDEELEVVSDFLYLGIRLNYNNKMAVAQKDLLDRASRAMFALLKKCKSKNFPIDVILDLFDKIVVPIATYGCEMWGFGNNDILQKLQLKFYKIVLRLRQSTPSNMVFGEIGKFPIDVIIKSRIMNYWYRLVSPENNNKLSALVYKCLLFMYREGAHENQYLKNVHKILIDTGLPYVWETHDISLVNKTWFTNHIKNHSQDMYILQWHTDLVNSSMYQTYRIFKNNFSCENYFRMLPYNCAISLARFRTTNNPLPVNVQRFLNVEREDRICTLCDRREVGDEFHYLFNCQYFTDKRIECIAEKYLNNANHHTLKSLFNSANKLELLKLKHFIDVLNNTLR